MFAEVNILVFSLLQQNLLPQLQLPEPLTPQRFAGIQPAVDQPAVDQLRARPALHVRLQQQPVSPSADPEGAHEGHQRAEAAAAQRAQGQGPL